MRPARKGTTAGRARPGAVNRKPAGVNVDLAARVRELEAVIQGLQPAVAAQADLARDEFLVNASHELRTPLLGMLLWTNLLLEQADITPAMREGLDAIKSCAEEQQTMIGELADMARIMAGKLRLKPHPIDLAHVVSSEVAALLPMATGKKLALEGTYDLAAGVVQADAYRLRQVVRNLIANAANCTPSGGRIALRLWRVKANVTLEVKDTGKGLTAESLTKIFDRGQMATDPSGPSFNGMGLGLAITRHLVELHGGSIVAKSPGVMGQGSTFTVILPLKVLSS
ncbi:MAG: HAMP domain-containing sensor histidine kinase [Opitutaceae bacterium]